MKTYHVSDGDGEMTYRAASPRDAARRFVAGGYHAEDETFWVHVSIWTLCRHRARRDACPHSDCRGGVEHLETVAVAPKEPDCVSRHGHVWASPHELVGGIEENPGVWGHGGGVIIHEACLQCGCARITNTWAQDPTDGTEGLTSVRYEPGRYILSDDGEWTDSEEASS